jgi:hypothetical protein
MVGILGMLGAPILIGGSAFALLAFSCRKKNRDRSANGR